MSIPNAQLKWHSPTAEPSQGLSEISYNVTFFQCQTNTEVKVPNSKTLQVAPFFIFLANCNMTLRYPNKVCLAGV